MKKIIYNNETVVGIGKLKIFMSSAFPYEIPTLSFIVSKDSNGIFKAICIQFLVNGFGETPQSAIKEMEDVCTEYLKTLFSNKDTAWDNLHNVFTDDFSKEIWDAYRGFQLNLAENGVSTDSKKVYLEKIAKLEKQIVDLKTALNQTGNNTVFSKIVDYQEVA